MQIIESNLTIKEGVEREKYWIKYYREETDYNVINKQKGGEIGHGGKIYTDEELKEHRKKWYQEHKEYFRKWHYSHKDFCNKKSKEYNIPTLLIWLL